MHKYIVAAVICCVTLAGMRAFGITFNDIFKAMQKDAANAAADIKALARGDLKRGMPASQHQPKVGANEGDYDADMKKELAEERQRFLEERRKAIDKILSSPPTDRAEIEALRKQIDQNVKDAAGKN